MPERTCRPAYTYAPLSRLAFAQSGQSTRASLDRHWTIDPGFNPDRQVSRVISIHGFSNRFQAAEVDQLARGRDMSSNAWRSLARSLGERLRPRRAGHSRDAAAVLFTRISSSIFSSIVTLEQDRDRDRDRDRERDRIGRLAQTTTPVHITANVLKMPSTLAPPLLYPPLTAPTTCDL